MEHFALKKVPLFANLTNEQLNEIADKGTVKTYAKYEMVLYCDQPETKFFVVLRGRLKNSRYTEDGQEAVFTFLSEGDFFGHMCVFENEISENNIITLEPAQVFSIHRTDFLEFLNLYPKININLLREMTQKIRRRNAHIKSLTVQNATGKVASTILRLADDQGAFNLGKIEISKLPTHRDIANMVGNSRETISRALKSLSRKGYIRREGNKLVICDYQQFSASFS